MSELIVRYPAIEILVLAASVLLIVAIIPSAIANMKQGLRKNGNTTRAP